MVTKMMKKMVMAGLGVEAKARETWEELVRRGEENQRDYAKKMKERVAGLEKDLSRLEKKERDLIDKVMAKLPLATKADLDRLEKKIQELTAKIKSG
ncbi:MAG TPA: phasin family protein [Nitrospiria bacterium]|nr:phasin family protein [Nitrospiria bacterium]